MREIIRLKNFTNSGERLDDLFVCTDGKGKFILNNDKSVFFAGNRHHFDIDDVLGVPESSCTDKEVFTGEIFLYKDKFGYLDDCMNWVYPPVNSIQGCKFYEKE